MADNSSKLFGLLRKELSTVKFIIMLIILCLFISSCSIGTWESEITDNSFLWKEVPPTNFWSSLVVWALILVFFFLMFVLEDFNLKDETAQSFLFFIIISILVISLNHLSLNAYDIVEITPEYIHYNTRYIKYLDNKDDEDRKQIKIMWHDVADITFEDKYKEVKRKKGGIRIPGNPDSWKYADQQLVIKDKLGQKIILPLLSDRYDDINVLLSYVIFRNEDFEVSEKQREILKRQIMKYLPPTLPQERINFY